MSFGLYLMLKIRYKRDAETVRQHEKAIICFVSFLRFNKTNEMNETNQMTKSTHPTNLARQLVDSSWHFR